MSDPIIEVPTQVAPMPGTEKPAMGEVDAAFEQMAKDAFGTDTQSEPLPKEAVSPPSEKAVSSETKPKLDFTPKKAEGTPTDDLAEAEKEVLGDSATPRKSEDWKRHKDLTKKVIRAKEEEALRYKTELDLLKTQGTPDTAALRKERDDLAARVKEMSVLGDPTITKDLDAKIAMVANQAKSGLDAKRGALLETIARMPSGEVKDKMLAEFFEDIPAHKQGIVGAHLATLEQLNGEREARLTEAKEHADEYLQRKQEEQTATVAQRREQLDKAFVSSVGELKSKEGWADLFGNAELARVIEGEAKQIFNGNLNDPKALAQKAIFAAVTPMLMQHALEQANKVAELEAALAQVRAAKPSVDATWTPQAKANDSADVFSLDGIANALSQQI
jgi:hypothetical protein